MNEKPHVVRSSEPEVGAARNAEERRVAEVARETEELGRALEGRDHLARFGTPQRAKCAPVQAGRSAGALMLMGRGIEIVQDACRRAVQLPRRATRKNSKTGTGARKAGEEKALAEETERKAAEEKLAAVAAATVEAAREVAEGQAQAAAQEGAKRRTAVDARLEVVEVARKAAEGKLKKQTEKAEADLAQERARSRALEQQLAAREDERKLLAQEHARSQALEQQLAAREDERKLLAQEHARSLALEQQLAAREDERKLLAQERARSRALEQQLAAREDERKLLAQERARSRALEQQLAAREDEQKLLAQERARSQALEQQLAAREDEQKLLAQERTRSQALEQQLAAHEDEQKLLVQERTRSQALKLQLAARRDAALDRGCIATASPLDRPALMQPAPDKPVTGPLPSSEMMLGNHKSVKLTEAPGNGEAAARLMTQARLLIDEGKIIAARSVLERAAESGSALALFLLAETYDPSILSAWGIFGRRGDVTKAQKLYAKAVAEGVHEAKYRLSVLR